MSIKTDFSASRVAAGHLMRISRDCGNVASVMRSKTGGIGQFWSGLSADALTEQLGRWNGATASLEGEMADLAAEIIRVANELEAQAQAALAAQQAAAQQAAQQAAAQQAAAQQKAAVQRAAQQAAKKLNALGRNGT